ncbi:MAG: hypothetical protein ACI9NQ_001069 [Paracoccaceae bacterium]
MCADPEVQVQEKFEPIPRAERMRFSTDIKRIRSISACSEAFAKKLDRPLSRLGDSRRGSF